MTRCYLAMGTQWKAYLGHISCFGGDVQVICSSTWPHLNHRELSEPTHFPLTPSSPANNTSALLQKSPQLHCRFLKRTHAPPCTWCSCSALVIAMCNNSNFRTEALERERESPQYQVAECYSRMACKRVHRQTFACISPRLNARWMPVL